MIRALQKLSFHLTSLSFCQQNYSVLYITQEMSKKLMEIRMHLQKTFHPIMVAKIFGTRVTRICSLISQLSSDWRDENLKYMTSKRHELKLPTYEYWRQLHTVSFDKQRLVKKTSKYVLTYQNKKGIMKMLLIFTFSYWDN